MAISAGMVLDIVLLTGIAVQQSAAHLSRSTGLDVIEYVVCLFGEFGSNRRFKAINDIGESWIETRCC